MLLPIPLLIACLVGVISVFVLLAAVGLLYRALRSYQTWQHRPAIRQRQTIQARQAGAVAVQDVTTNTSDRDPSHDALRHRSVWVPLVTGLTLLVFTFAGRDLIGLGFRHGSDEPGQLNPATARDIAGPGGSRIHVQTFGRPDAPTLVFTHGWGTSNTEWYYAKRQLADRFHLIFWDIGGLGASRATGNRDF